MFGLLLLKRSAVCGLAISVLAVPAAMAAPAVKCIDVVNDGLTRLVFDDGGWRVRSHKCCRGGLDGSRAGLLATGHARRLGEARNRYDDSRTYGDRVGGDEGDFSSRYGESIYEWRLTPPRVFQPGAGGGYFGNPD
jgi:hypothetical protein